MIDPQLLFERCLYIGNILAGIIYGLEVYIAFHTIHLLARGHHTQSTSRLLLIVYISLLILSQTLALASQAGAGQLMWVEHRDFPGGPVAYFNSTGSSWNNLGGTVFVLLTNFMGDAFLLYRCYIICDSNALIVALPFLMFLGSAAMGIVALVQSAIPGSGIFAQQSVNFVIPWVSLTAGLNVILTALICVRLLITRRDLLRAEVTEIKVYTSLVAILVESALPFSILGIIFAALLGKAVTVYVVLSVFWGGYAGLAPLLIIHRVALGKAWSKKTMTDVDSSRLIFATNTTNDSTLGVVSDLNETCTADLSRTTLRSEPGTRISDSRV
ncbi:hypothetical protein D9758_017949 [Tetrapyrgos nigripes]|uniref:Uncharacterized protein n=1 Tax=Tetrapyrgos nigripes TaxID=182062 RepID=A0A8H5F9T4_9AGAR|nr:hypothetical protein D9758_017949 [Tetrapyrgos nigripes]